MKKLLMTTSVIVSIFGWNIHVYGNQNTNADVNTLKLDPVTIEQWRGLPSKSPSEASGTTKIDPFENRFKWLETVPIGTKIQREIKRIGEVCNETLERTNHGYKNQICCSSTDRLSYTYSCSSGSSSVTIK